MTATTMRIKEEHLARVTEMEARSYPEDEKASPEALRFRAEEANDYFLVRVEGGEIEGYVCGTLTAASTLTHDSMSSHEKNGSCLCIHSVVVEETKRRKGVGTLLLRDYCAWIRDHCPQVNVARLLCKHHLLAFYGSVGFENQGQSPVVHGKDVWYEMKMEFRS